MAGLDPSPPGRPKAKYNGSAPASEDRARRRAGALRSSTESGRLPYWPRGPPTCSIDLDFLGPSRFCPRTARKQGLDFLGFPWILSSESRLFNGLRGILREENFSRPFAARAAARDRSRYSYDTEMQYDSSSKPNSFSAFLQLPLTEIVDPLSSRDGALSRTIGYHQRYFTQSTRR
jgi:hypothetical protein